MEVSTLTANPPIMTEVIASALREHSVSVEDYGNVPEVDKDSKSSQSQASEQTVQMVQPDIPTPAVNVAPPAMQGVGKYRLLRTIGKGNFAKVKLAVHIATGVEVAIKIVNKTTLDVHLLNRLKREMNIMKSTNHPNIVKLLEVIENEDVMCLVMEYASGGEIFDYLVAHGRVREKEAREKFRQLLSAIQYCHSKRIVHRDLKAENILLDPDLNVKVADFGLANTFEVDQRLNTFCGSPPYAAPELFLGVPYYGPGVDIWSLGVLLFTLVIGHLPFDARDLRELRTKIIGLHYSIPKGFITPECETLLRKMLVLDPKERSSLKTLMQDKWVNIGCETLRPYKEPRLTSLDEKRLEIMESMGYTKTDIEASVLQPQFDHTYATYHLLPSSAFMATDTRSDRDILVGQDAESKEKPVITAPAAIGRFTVAPSSASQEPRMANQRQQPQTKPIADLTYDSHAGAREHHSLTTTLPVALRKAFASMGKTLGAGPPAPSSLTEESGRAYSQAATSRVPHKSSFKGNGEKHAITAAPVPIVSNKKSQLTASTTKRSSPVPSGTPVRTSTPDSTQTPTMSIGSKTASAKKGQRPSTGPPQHRSSQTRPKKPMAPLAEDPLKGKSSPVPEGEKASTVTYTQIDGKSNAGSSGSSESPREASPRRRSTSSIQDVWIANKLQSEPQIQKPTDQPVTMKESLTDWSSEQQRPSINAKLSHTVQGNEAQALQMEIEKANRPVINAAVSNVPALDAAHGNTWSRGVFKALGGLFGPTKSHDASASANVTTNRSTIGPRVVRFPFSVDTTSSKTAEELLSCVIHALEVTQGCRFTHPEPFLLQCSWAADLPPLRPDAVGTESQAPIERSVATLDTSGGRDNLLHFEMEVCQLPRLHLRGVRVKRIKGSAIQYREVIKSVMKALRL